VRLERAIGRDRIGGEGMQVTRVQTSEIMKAFRNKSDFIRILTIEGKPPPTHINPSVNRIVLLATIN
jgi:hypothetical protein